MSELIKIGNQIVPKTVGLDYDLENGKIYDLKREDYTGMMYLEENGSFNMPEKLYFEQKDLDFIDRVITYFKITKKNTTGVLLNGIKGTGKTVTAKQMAIKSGLPIIIPHTSFPSWGLIDFFKKLKTEVVVLIDEIEKTRDTEKILTFLDGVEQTCKKLVIMTSNDSSKINENLFDRPSRVRYYREFENNNSVYIKEILSDQGIEDANDKIYNFITTYFKTISIDNIMTLIEEIKIFGNDALVKLTEHLNILPDIDLESNEPTNKPVIADDPVENPENGLYNTGSIKLNLN